MTSHHEQFVYHLRQLLLHLLGGACHAQAFRHRVPYAIAMHRFHQLAVRLLPQHLAPASRTNVPAEWHDDQIRGVVEVNLHLGMESQLPPLPSCVSHLGNLPFIDVHRIGVDKISLFHIRKSVF